MGRAWYQRPLGVWGQQILGLVNASPRGIRRSTIEQLVDEREGIISVQTMLTRFEKSGYVTYDDGLWYPTERADQELLRTWLPYRWISGPEAAQRLGVTHSVFKGWVKRGGIPYLKPGRYFYFNPVVIDALTTKETYEQTPAR